MLFLAACHPVVWVPAPLPTVAADNGSAFSGAVEAAQGASGTPSAIEEAGSVVSGSVRALEPPVPSNDELAKTAAGVFGEIKGSPNATAIESEVPVWDLDVQTYETHERVAHYVELFSADAGGRFSSRLSRGTRYDQMIRAKLRASGLPEDLSYLALIESGYDPDAYSKAAAVGMWQFMTATAKDVGLRVDWWIDERRDPVRSTEGAIKFLDFLQKQFGSLYLAAAAYNGGPGRVARGLTRFAGELEGANGEDRYFALAEQDYLRDETKNYVPQLIGAALVAKTPLRYGLNVDTVAALAYDSVHVAAGTSLAAVAIASGSTSTEIKELNPSILRGVAPPDASLWVHVPEGLGVVTDSVLREMPDSVRSGFRTVKVKGASTSASGLAKKDGITLKQLRWYNPSLRTTRKGNVVAGQSVRVPTRNVVAFARDVPDPAIERYGGASTTLSKNGFHVVRRGETLGGIAIKYRTTVARLQSLNSMKGTKLMAGQTLKVSGTAQKPVARKTTTKTTAKR